MNLQDIETILTGLKQWGNFNSAALYLTKSICELCRWPYGEIWQPDRNNEFMVWTGFWGSNNDYFEKVSKYSSIHKFGKGIGLIGKSWQKKEVLIVENVSKDNDFLRTDIMLSNGLNHAVCLPLPGKNSTRCVLCFFLKNITAVDKENAGNLSAYREKIGAVISSLT